MKLISINNFHAMEYNHCKMCYCLIENVVQLTDGWSTRTIHDTTRGISEGGGCVFICKDPKEP